MELSVCEGFIMKITFSTVAKLIPGIPSIEGAEGENGVVKKTLSAAGV